MRGEDVDGKEDMDFIDFPRESLGACSVVNGTFPSGRCSYYDRGSVHTTKSKCERAN
jgi:hypothetical protein